MTILLKHSKLTPHNRLTQQSAKVADSFIRPLIEVQYSLQKLPIYVTAGHIMYLKWVDALAHASLSLSSSHLYTGLFMAQRMAH